jgi:diguanylate cyclase (GGDEF)-like protein
VAPGLSDVEELVALGAFVGAQILIVIFSVVRANAYRERPLMLHAAATMMAVLTVQSLSGAHPIYPEAGMLLMLTLAGLQLRDLVSHAGAMRSPRRLLMAASVLLPVLAGVSVLTPWALLPGVGVWMAVVLVLLLRAWPQSRPWIGWLIPGVAALLLAAILLAARAVVQPDAIVLWVAGLFTVWAGCTYLATGWRGRIFGETRARIDARNTTDPLTGLATQLVLQERIHAARTMMQRYGHPSVLLLVHIENLHRLLQELGPEVAEQAVLAGANRIRDSLRQGDVAARLAHSRFAVLVEGVPLAEAAGNVASRMLVAGLKEPLPAAPAEFLQFRIVLTGVPVTEVPVKLLLSRLSARMEQELAETSQRRIVTVSSDELLASEKH